MNSTHVNQQSTVWFSVSLGLLGVIVGYALASIPAPGGSVKNPSAAPSAPTPSAPPAPTAGPVPPVDLNKDHVRGDPQAKLTLITYSDFECPFSKRHHATISQLADMYKGKVNFVYRHFPLSFHQNAQKEAEASECANELGGNDAFWKFADGIYEKTTSNGTGFPLDGLVPLAKSIGLDGAKFQACLDSGKYAQLVKDEETGGQGAGVTGTPGHILYDEVSKKGTAIPGGAKPVDSFKTVIDAALAGK